MTGPADIQERIMALLSDHFSRTDAHLSPEQICDLTGFGLPEVQNALRVLMRANKIEGIEPPEFNYPIEVTGIRY